MELGQLRSFLSIVEHRSFTRAAEELDISQPALSQQVARLERELGCRVFERQGRQVRLTEAGLVLRDRAVEILALAEDTLKQLRDDGTSGRLRIGAIPTVAPYLMPRILAAFRERHSHARVELSELVTERLVKECLRGELDLGVLALPAEVEGLEVEPLFEEPLWVVLPQGHELTRGGPTLELHELRKAPFVLLNEEHCLSGQIASFCRSRSLQPLTSGRANQLATVLELVSLGQGISFVPDMARQLDTGSGRVYRSIAPDPPRRTIAACRSPARYQSKLAREMMSTIRAVVAGGS